MAQVARECGLPPLEGLVGHCVDFENRVPPDPLESPRSMVSHRPNVAMALALQPQGRASDADWMWHAKGVWVSEFYLKCWVNCIEVHAVVV